MLREKINTHRESRQESKQEAQLDYDAAPERPLDALKTDDREILGEEPSLLRGRYRAKTDKIIQRNNKAEAKADIISMREKFIAYRDDRTDVKIARLREKLNNSSDSFLAQQINRQREQKLENLEFKKRVHADKIGKLETKRKKKPEELQKQIDIIVNKKIDAMRRKAERKLLKEEHGIGRRNFVKRAEFLANMSQDDKRKIVREAILLARKKNIETGRLDTLYKVDEALATRKTGDLYERTVE